MNSVWKTQICIKEVLLSVWKMYEDRKNTGYEKCLVLAPPIWKWSEEWKLCSQDKYEKCIAILQKFLARAAYIRTFTITWRSNLNFLLEHSIDRVVRAIDRSIDNTVLIYDHSELIKLFIDVSEIYLVYGHICIIWIWTYSREKLAGLL